MPSPRRCLDDIHRTLPELAAALTQKLLNETTHAQERLQTDPQDVAEFVEWTAFLRETNTRQPEFGQRPDRIGNEGNASLARGDFFRYTDNH